MPEASLGPGQTRSVSVANPVPASADPFEHCGRPWQQRVVRFRRSLAESERSAHALRTGPRILAGLRELRGLHGRYPPVPQLHPPPVTPLRPAWGHSQVEQGQEEMPGEPSPARTTHHSRLEIG